MNKMMEIILTVILCLLIIFLSVIKQNSLKLFTPNGHFMKLNISLDEWNNIKNRPRVDCNDKQLVECKVKNTSFDCFHCNEILATCVYFETDQDLFDDNGKKIGMIPKSKDVDTGYCMKLNDISSRKCDSKTGGQWILAKSGTQFSYVCHCSVPSVFGNSYQYGPCEEFNGCLNGKIKDGWSSIENIECDCNDGYTFEKNGIYPSCKYTTVPLRDSTLNMPIDLIDPNHRAKNENLINPCIVDARTGEINANNGRLVTVEKNNEKVAYCVATNDRFVTIRYNDDYLLNNQGKYANGIFSFTDRPVNSDVIYETHSKDENDELYPVFNGKRILTTEFALKDKFPYLLQNSLNMGGFGTRYVGFATTNYYKSHVYIYNAHRPTEPLMPVGIHSAFHPVFTHHLFAENKNYNGNVAFTRVPLSPCGFNRIINLWKGPLNNRFPEFRIGGFIEAHGWEEKSDTRLTSLYVAPSFCVDKFNKVLINPYTATFTGIFLNSIKDNVLTTVRINPGVVDTAKYRTTFDPEWTAYRIKDGAYYYENTNRPQMLIGNELAGLTNSGFDCEITNSTYPEWTRYDCTEDTFKWRDDY